MNNAAPAGMVTLYGLLFAGLAGLPALAQTFEFPLEIEADGGIEWRRDEQSLVAQGKVVMTRGDTELRAENISAHYRDTANGKGQEVYRVDASGSVRISSDGTQAFGDSAAYDLDQGIFVLTGKMPRLEASDLVVTAAQNLEYWQAKNLAVARGAAVAKSQDRRIAADVLSAYVEPSETGESELRRVEAFGRVVITTAENRASGDEAVYDARSGVATLCGDVEIRRGSSSLRGRCAEVDLNTGVSRLLGGGGGITGLVAPQK